MKAALLVAALAVLLTPTAAAHICIITDHACTEQWIGDPWMPPHASIWIGPCLRIGCVHFENPQAEGTAKAGGNQKAIENVLRLML